MLKIYDHRYYDYDSSIELINHITDWEEVTDDELRLLKRFADIKNYVVVKCVENQRSIIERGIKTVLEEIRIEEQRQQELKQIQEQKKQQRLLKKRAKDEEAEKKLLAELLKKHGTE